MILTLDRSGERLDAALARLVPELSRSQAQRLIEQGAVTCGGRPVKKNEKLLPGDTLTLTLPEVQETALEAQEIPLDVCYEDADVIVVNKPKGLVVHPAPGHPDGTLVNALLAHCGDSLSGIGGERRPGIVHRIDKDTSGLLVIAKTPEAKTSLCKQFFYHTTRRLYNALVWGPFAEDEGTIVGNIGRHPKDRLQMAVYPPESEIGKPAVTHYRVLERFGPTTLVECRLETGRTHQIRAHMRHLGHPLFADERYGGDQILRGEKTASYKAFIHNCMEICPRQALHARTLGFRHPLTGEEMDFSSPLPDDMTRLIEKWRKKV